MVFFISLFAAAEHKKCLCVVLFVPNTWFAGV